MKLLIIAILTITSAWSNPRALSVTCEEKNADIYEGARLYMTVGLKHADSKPEIELLHINGDDVVSDEGSNMFNFFSDDSELPVFNNGVYTFNFRYNGLKLEDNVEISVEKCDNSFENTGTATIIDYNSVLKKTTTSKLTCTCKVKDWN